MHGITATNVNTAFSAGLHWLRVAGELEDSRNGKVLVAPEPVCTTYKNPAERVLFSPERDANPYFHLMEGIWMLAGRGDLASIEQFNKGMAKYSDDGKGLNGAYGWRWRGMFGFDQLTEVVNELSINPTSRRCVLAMYDPVWDMQDNPESLDIPCNTHIYFDCRHNKLNMTVCCRSNDAIWGAYGANAVHMSMLMEYIATAIGLPLGDYRQISNNFHAYIEVEGVEALIRFPHSENLYRTEGFEPYPMVSNPVLFLKDCELFCENPLLNRQPHNPFFDDVARPMFKSWTERKAGKNDGLSALAFCKAKDWKYACEQWILRRVK